LLRYSGLGSGVWYQGSCTTVALKTLVDEAAFNFTVSHWLTAFPCVPMIAWPHCVVPASFIGRNKMFLRHKL
jgi:hypothetical protein